MDFFWHRRAWVLICEFLPIHDVALGLEPTCRKLQKAIDHEEVWKPKLLQFLWYRSSEILLANPKTSMRLCYMKSKRVVDLIEGSLCSFSYNFHRSQIIVHCSGLPFRSLSSICVLRSGNIFGKASQFAIFDVHSFSLLTISQPNSSHDSGFSVPGAHCVFYVTSRIIQKYDLLLDQWTDVHILLPSVPLNSFRCEDTLYIAHQHGFTKVDVQTWHAEFSPFQDERVSRCGYIISFHTGKAPIFITRSLIAEGSQKTYVGDVHLIEAIPKESMRVCEDNHYVYFGRGRDLFRYSKQRNKIERFYCGSGGIDRSMEYKRNDDKRTEERLFDYF